VGCKALTHSVNPQLLSTKLKTSSVTLFTAWQCHCCKGRCCSTGEPSLQCRVHILTARHQNLPLFFRLSPHTARMPFLCHCPSNTSPRQSAETQSKPVMAAATASRFYGHFLGDPGLDSCPVGSLPLPVLEDNLWRTLAHWMPLLSPNHQCQSPEKKHRESKLINNLL